MARITTSLVRTIACLSVGVFGLSTGTAFAADDFYKGKTITIHSSGGGTYEAYGRYFAKYMPKYLPGEPTIIVKSLPGAAGLKAANYIYNNAPRDGTEIAIVHGQIPTMPLLGASGIQYDPNKIGWLGNVTKEVYLGYMWHTSPVQSWEEATRKESVIGGQSLGSFSIDLPVLTNALAGTKFKIVSGYSGSEETQIAIERGEVNGHMGTSYGTITRAHPDWFKEKKVKVISQFGQTKHRELQDVPLLVESVKGDDRQALELYLARQETARPFLAPPGVPAERLALLRSAWSSVMKDPAFLAEAARADFEIVEPMNGDELQKFVARMSQTPPSAVKLLNDVFTKYAATK
jgi:tripartite-type tricarboxylate transporter receptor subunit TctC